MNVWSSAIITEIVDLAWDSFGVNVRAPSLLGTICLVFPFSDGSAATLLDSFIFVMADR